MLSTCARCHGSIVSLKYQVSVRSIKDTCAAEYTKVQLSVNHKQQIYLDCEKSDYQCILWDLPDVSLLVLVSLGES